MIYGVILASGKGTRMGNISKLPKQFMSINNIPIIIYTLRSMLSINKFDKIYIAVSEEYFEHASSLLNQYEKDNMDKISIVTGGKERIDSIINVINTIKSDNKVSSNDIVVIHDAVRPFITEDILLASIDGAKKYKAVVAACPVADTLLVSNDGLKVDSIVDRKLYFKGQSPDSFNLELFIQLLNNLSDGDKKMITGTSQICTFNNYPIYIIKGDDINFKITTKSDFMLADSLMIKGDNNDNK